MSDRLSPSLIEIKRVLEIRLPVDLQPEMLHVDLAKAFSHTVKERLIWVYDKGVLLRDEPFTSFVSVMEAIGYSKSSIAARRSIDTVPPAEKLLEGVILFTQNHYNLTYYIFFQASRLPRKV